MRRLSASTGALAVKGGVALEQIISRVQFRTLTVRDSGTKKELNEPNDEEWTSGRASGFAFSTSKEIITQEESASMISNMRDFLSPLPQDSSAAASSSPQLAPQSKSERTFLKTSAKDEYVMSAGATPRSIEDLHHRTQIGAKIESERRVVSHKYGGEAAEAKARSEARALAAVREAATIEEIVDLVALKSTRASTALVAEAASVVLRLSTEIRIPKATHAEIMLTLASDTNTDANSRWAVTPDEVLQYQRHLAVKRSLVRSVSTGEDDASIRKLLNVLISKNIPPTVGALCDMALADISFPTGMQLLEAYSRLMGPEVAPPSELLTRILSLVTPSKYEEALGLYNTCDAGGILDSFPPAVHGHALHATRFWWIATCSSGGEAPPPLTAQLIKRQVKRIVRNIGFRVELDIVESPANDSRELSIFSAARIPHARVTAPTLKGEEGVYVLSNAVIMLSSCGEWPTAERLLGLFSTPASTIAGRAQQSANSAISDEDLEAEAEAEAEEEDAQLQKTRSSSSPSSHLSLSESKKRRAARAAEKLSREGKLLLHTPTTLVNGMSAALNSKSLPMFDQLRAQFDAVDFSFSDCEHFTLLAFLGALSRNKFGGVSFEWVEKRLIRGFIRVEEETENTPSEGGSDEDTVLQKAFDSTAVTPRVSRAALEALLRTLGSLALNVNAIRVPGAVEPSATLWASCLQVYLALMSLPIVPYRSSIVLRAQSLGAMYNTLLNCFRVFKAPPEAVCSLASSVAELNKVDSAEFGIFCGALLRANALLSGIGSAVATEASTLRFIRSPHHCIRLLAQTAAKAPQGIVIPLHMVQSRRGVGVYLRYAVAKRLISWQRALDLLLCHPLVASQDPVPDPAIFLDIAVIASFCDVNDVGEGGLITLSGMPYRTTIDDARPASRGASVPVCRENCVVGSSPMVKNDVCLEEEIPIRVNDLVLFALAMAPRSLVDSFMSVSSAPTIQNESSRKGGVEGNASGVSALRYDKSTKERRAAADEEADEDGLYGSAGASQSVGTLNAHLISFLAAATHVPRDEAWRVFDNQRHRLRAHALEFFSQVWNWKVDTSRQPILAFFKDEPENYFAKYVGGGSNRKQQQQKVSSRPTSSPVSIENRPVVSGILQESERVGLMEKTAVRPRHANVGIEDEEEELLQMLHLYDSGDTNHEPSFPRTNTEAQHAGSFGSPQSVEELAAAILDEQEEQYEEYDDVEGPSRIGDSKKMPTTWEEV